MAVRALVATALLLAAALAGCVGPAPPGCDPCPTRVEDGAGDVVVVAVIDSGLNPYHFDFRASLMPQAQDDEDGNDLPLAADPATWLPAFPPRSAFASLAPLNLTLPDDASALPDELHEADAAAWATVQASTPDEVHLRWVPGTKVVGFVTFAEGDGYAAGSHGVGVASASVGNLHGTCPECVFVFVDGYSEAANRWVEAQDWIDVQVNSWGISSAPSFCTPAWPGEVPRPPPPVPTQKCGLRDRVYAGSDTEAQRKAVERGQAIFFSAGNGLLNDFSAPNPTLASSQEGPDWIVTVGAVSPQDRSPYSGAGKPVDVAGVSPVPAAGSGNVTGLRSFGGTSSATPQVAGEYARALWKVREELSGPSRVQAAGIVAQEVLPCPDLAICLPGPGIHFTAVRDALFASAAPPNPNWNASRLQTLPASTAEAALLAAGHGVLAGRADGWDALDERTERIADMALGAAEMPPPDFDRERWFAADSYCRQGVWGAWEHGAFVEGMDLPEPDPEWPARTYYVTACPESIRALVDASRLLPDFG